MWSLTKNRPPAASAVETTCRAAWMVALALVVCPAAALGASPLGPTGASSESLMKMGLLPVTQYGARPDDDVDDTAAIQRAVDAARDGGRAVFFPPGRYLVSDTIRAMQRTELAPGTQRWVHQRNRPNVLLGATTGARPTLVLAPNARAFDDPEHPKPLVWIWAQPRNHTATGKARELGSVNPENEQPNISMNQVFKGIDIDLRAPGNRGAVGIRHAGSQGSTLEDVVIHAEGAYAGIVNPPGQGGGSYGVTIHGGRYGIQADAHSRFPVLAGVRLIGQQDAALRWEGQSNLTLAGFVVEWSGKSAPFRLYAGRTPAQGALTLVDGVVTVHGGLAIDNAAGANLFIRNVSVSGAHTLVRSANGEAIAPAKGAWTQVTEYAYGGQQGSIVENGKAMPAGLESKQIVPGAAPDAEALVARHLWGKEFPAFDQPGVVNALDLGATPDDGSDDSAAIERALARSKKVFLPAGVYLLGRTLVLPAGAQLFGAVKQLSVLRASPSWQPPAGTPLVDTEDSADADTSLSFLRIESSSAQAQTPLRWRAGRHSVVRDVMVGLTPNPAGERKGRILKDEAGARRKETYLIEGHGGGRWYAVTAEWNAMRAVTGDADYRHLRIRGTREPLALYGVNVERSRTAPQAEISNAENVALYYLKGEALKDQRNLVLSVVASRNVSVYGYSGVGTPGGGPVIALRDSSDVLLANIAPLRVASGAGPIVELHPATVQGMKPAEALVLFKQDGRLGG